MTLYVSVRKATIQKNYNQGTNDPPYEIRTAKDDRDPKRVHLAEFYGTVRLIYDRENPLVSGAVCWLEVEEEVSP